MNTWSMMLLTLVISGVFSRGLIPIAWKLGLVDNPCERKQHNGNIPLIGGLSVFFSTVLVFTIYFELSDALRLFILASSFMVLIGLIDDRYDLGVRVRMVAQLFIASIIVFGSGIYVFSLGNLFGLGDIDLGLFGIPFTLLAIMAAMNAYNMVDGIDGLLGALGSIAFIGIAMLGYIQGQTFTVDAALIIACAIIPFLMRNTGFPVKTARKIFMGDAGSMFIGLSIVWLLTLLTNTSHIDDSGIAVRPVAVLWLIAVPLMDMFAIMARRIQKGQSPFKPDRQHLHHVFMYAGCRDRKSLAIIVTYAVSLVVFGLVLEWLVVPEFLVLSAFLLVFAIYCYTLRNISYVVHAWNKIFKRT